MQNENIDIDFNSVTREELFNILDNIELTEDEHEKIKYDIYIASEFRFENKDKKTLYTYLYKLRYKLKCPTTDMCKFFNLRRESMAYKLKEVGWQYTKSESSLMATKKRDYKQIRLKSRFTLLDNNKVFFGSSVEEYIRQRFNLVLSEMLEDYDVIVGVNNLSILKDGMEADIPIIIMGFGSVFKYVIEPGATCWHTDIEHDISKELLLKQKGYNTFRMVLKDNNFNKIDKEINKIASIIVECVTEKVS